MTDHFPAQASRRALIGAGLAAAMLPRPLWAEGAVRVRDLLGREVVLKRPAQRVVLGSGRYIGVLNLLLPDPAAVLAGWSDDFRRAQAGEYAPYRSRFPALDRVPVLARGNEPMPAETVLGLRPDLVLLTRSAAAEDRPAAVAPGAAAQPTGLLMRTLAEAGVPVAVVDFFQQPLVDTEPSLQILGQLLGREAQAERFLAFYRAHLERLRALAVGETTRPSVFMHAHAGGLECCYSPGRGTFDDFIRMAGGRNIAEGKLPGVTGQLGLEYVLSANPDLYVATGGPYGGRGGVSLGAGVAEAAARDSLEAMLQRQGLEGLEAVKRGRAHAIWHGFNDSPAHLIAAELLARWLHPETAAAIDPAATLRELNGFAAVPMDGTYWVDLRPA